jgi:DNA polymerase elongation subunit (family B)
VKLIQDYDVLLAWNGDGYDFFVLRARLKRHGIKIDWRNWCWLDHMRVVKKVLMSIADSDFKRSFALDAIGENVLGINKIKLSVPPGQMKLLLGERVAELEAYNRRDVEIMLQIEQRKEYLALHYMVCSMCRTFPNRGSIYPNELADGILMRLAIQEGRHFPTRDKWGTRDDDKKKYEGAFVMDPDIGFHQSIQVPDFASLYPSIILSWNMSNETVLKDSVSYPNFNGEYAQATATGVCFRTDIEGIIPRALKKLIAKRGEYKQRAKQYEVGSEEYKNMTNLSTAVKVITNSFYGLIGNEGSRFYDQDIARSVTLTGQLLIRQVMKYFEHKGYPTVYGDTDSVFVKCSVEEMKAEIDDINEEFIPGLLYNVGCINNYVKLDFDKGFSTLLLITKKRYVGKLALAKGRIVSTDVDPEVKGLETQRSDQVRYGQNLLKLFMNMLIEVDCDPSIVDRMLRDEADKFFTKDLTIDEIEISESVKSYPEQYTVATPPVKVAQQMIDAGMEFFPGMKVPYIVLEHKPNITAIHSSLFDGTCDRKYYWEKRILPPILRLLEVRFPDYPFNSFTNPGQIIFNFSESNSPQRKRRVRQPTMVKRQIRRPSEKPQTRRVRTPNAMITVPNTERDSIIKAIADLVRLHQGAMPLNIIVITDDGAEVIIKTKEMVSREGLEEIAQRFPSLIITPKPI